MTRRIAICCALAASALIGSLAGYGIYGDRHVAEKPESAVVAYSADPSVKNDNPIVLGYPGQRFSVTCSEKTKQCTLEIENQKSNTVKVFEYVEQEWFNPQKSNRPWHTLDVIMTLPSYSGNPGLKFTKNPEQNRHLVDVMVKNGWVGQ